MKQADAGYIARMVGTAAGWVGWLETAEGVRRVTLPQPSRDQVATALDTTRCQEASPAECELAARLMAFYAGKAVDFADIPLALPGETPFQAAVRRVVRSITRGSTMSYGEVAAAVGRPGAGRAVGQVMARNPVPPLIPCHRVLASGGGLGGFGGGLELKAALLSQEGGS